MNDSAWITGTLNFKVSGADVHLSVTVPTEPVKPMRMLPVFQKMSNAFVDLSVKMIEEQGEQISCCAGCGACCRQGVPIAEIEVYQLAELVEQMPEPRRSSVKERFEKAFKHFSDNGWLKKMEGYPDLSIEARQQLVLEYLYEWIPCPFLEAESCSIHEHRPLGCREYLVTSPAENCSAPTAQTIKMVPQPMEVSKKVRNMASSGNLGDMGFVPLIRALEWAARFPENFEEKSGQEWTEDFFKDLEELKKNE